MADASVTAHTVGLPVLSMQPGNETTAGFQTCGQSQLPESCPVQDVTGAGTITGSYEQMIEHNASDVHTVLNSVQTGFVTAVNNGHNHNVIHLEPCLEPDNKTIYSCAGCRDTFYTICSLHAHLKVHGSGGSYYFNHTNGTAYPRFDIRNSFVQTDIMLNDGTVTDVNKPAEELKNSEKVENEVVKQTRTRKRKNETLQNTNAKKPKGTKKTSVSKPSTDLPTKVHNRTPVSKNKGKGIGKKQITLPVNGLQKRTEKPKQEKKQKKPKLKDTKAANKNKAVKESRTITINIKALKHDVEQSDHVQKETLFQQSFIQELKNGEYVKDEIKPDADVKMMSEVKPDLKEEADRMPEVYVDIADVSEGEDTETDSVQLQYMMQDKIDDKEEKMNKKTIKKQTKTDKHVDKDKEKLERVPKERKKREKKAQEDIFQSCEVCNEIMLQKRIKAHMVMHTGEKSFICEICGQAYAKNSNLYRHKITHREVKPFCCTLCPAQFCRKKDYTYHLNSHKGTVI